MKTKHFIVVHDWINYCDRETEIIGVTHSESAAKKILKKQANEERQYALERGFVIHEDCDTNFDAGADGEYACKHTHLYIRVV